MADQAKKNTFFGGVATLATGVVIVKLIGALYKIPLANILGETGNGYFTTAYNIYNVFLTISTAGLPVALSKTVSECNALGRQNQKDRVFRVAFTAFLTMGILSFICMSVFSQLVATHVLQNEKAVYAVLALSPAVLCTCCCSAFRGYAQGHLNMVPTGVSQIMESLCKLFLGLGLTLLILHSAIQPDDLRERLSAVGALAGVSIGSILSVTYLAINHIRTRRQVKTPATDRPDRSRDILSRLLKPAIPITLSSCTTAIVTLIDTSLVNGQLQNVFAAIADGLTDVSNSFLDIFPKSVAIYQENVAALAKDPTSGIVPVLDSARSLFGAYQKTMSVYNLPFNLMIPLTACIVPGVSACIARRDGLIHPILVGPPDQLRPLLDRLGASVPEEDLVPAGTEAECAARAVALVRQGRGSLLIKGRLSTGALLGAVVDRAGGIRGDGLLSHVAILEVPAYHKLLYITDGGLVVAPGLEEKRAILRNALSLCRFLGYERPKAAALCAAETVSPRMPETGDAAALREEGERGDFGPCLVEGPISLDLATSAEAARLKGYCSPVAGDADILLVPSIAAGNLLGKALYGLAGGKMAGVVLGASVPIALNSRGASWEEKYNSILICAAMSRR